MGDVQTPRWWMERAGGWNVGQLRATTLDYWHGYKPSTTASEEERIAWYIQTLLPEELRYATENHELKTDLSCDTLVLLVGYSIEPLLQIISVYEPARVILLLNREYANNETGKRRGRKIKGRITDFLKPLLAKSPEIQVEVISKDKHLADKPEAVFRALCQHVLPHQRDGKDVVVDITGGKKSMDVGAFLFAAYAGIRVSYVDFDEYQPQERRPFGFTCRIGELENPYVAFSLRDWERVRQLYEQYHFRAAGKALQEIIRAMYELAFTPQQLTAVQNFQQVIKLYALWDDGDYHAAQTQLASIHSWVPTFIAPSAIEVLGPHWPDLRAARNARDVFNLLVNTSGWWPSTPRTPNRKAFFESNAQLITYARDELAKIERLKNRNEDPRSALLRAAGLDELLLKARWSRLFRAGLLHKRYEYGPVLSDPAVHKELLSHDNVRYMRKNLQTGGLDVKIGAEKIKVCPDTMAPTLNYERGLTLTGDEVVDLRNQTIHQYVSIPPTIAKAAYQLAQTNLDDFITRWAVLDNQKVPPEGRVTRMAWKDVCRLCGLDFLPLMHKEQS